MKKRIRLIDREELKEIITTKGYWSIEFSIFLDKFCGSVKDRVHTLALSYSRELKEESKN